MFDQHDTVFLGAAAHKPHACIDQSADPDRFRVKLVLARLDLRHIENVADQVKQQCAALVDELGIFHIA